MFDLPHPLGRDTPLHLLCLGAHADDIEIGAGGTVLRLLAERPRTHVRWIVLSGGGTGRDAEARTSAAAFLRASAEATVQVEALRDGLFPQDAETLRTILRAAREAGPADLVLTHRLDDAHQDHRAVAEATWQTFRGTSIAAYEIPKWEGDGGRPNAYVTLPDDVVDHKLALLAEHFPSQAAKPWYDAETFRGLLRLRGIEAAVRYAEAFECAKLVW